MKTYGELKSDFTINEQAQGGDEGSSDDEGGVEFEEADIDDICELGGFGPVALRHVAGVEMGVVCFVEVVEVVEVVCGGRAFVWWLGLCVK